MEEKIIEYVRNNRILFDKTHGGYKNIISKEKKWEEIACEVNQPVEKVKKRWKTIRDRYYRVLKDDKCASLSGSGQKVPAGEKYKYFEQLSFLGKCEHFNSNTVGNFDDIDVLDCDNENLQPLDCYIAESTRSSSTPRSNKKSAEMQVHKEMLHAIKSFNEKNSKCSPIMLFMQSVAFQVEASNLSPERLLDLQTGILNLVKYAVSDVEVEIL